ncbi:MAG: hypothetical protein ABIJ05_05530 [Patescibacteria group bacterium]
MGDLISDVRTHFVPNSTDYQILKSLLVLKNHQLTDLIAYSTS